MISGYVNNLCTKSCALDPVPSSVFQRCQHRLVPIITRIVNLTLQGGQVPDRFKVGVIKPLLKKSGADHETFQIFGQHRICIFYVKSRRKQLQHNYVITLMVTRVSLKNFNQRINVITVLKPHLSESIMTF